MELFSGIWIMILQGLILLETAKGVPTGPFECPLDAVCKSTIDCSTGYYMTTDMKTFFCGPRGDVENMVCCHDEESIEAGQTTIPINDYRQIDDSIKAPGQLTNDPEVDNNKSYQDSNLQTEGYSGNGPKIPLPLPDLPQDGFNNGGDQEPSVQIQTDPIELNNFQNNSPQPPPSIQDHHDNQINPYPGFVNPPPSIGQRARDEENPAFNPSNQYHTSQQQPRRDSRQSYQYYNLECPCTKGDIGPPGVKGDQGEPGKIVYLPVFVNPNSVTTSPGYYSNSNANSNNAPTPYVVSNGFQQQSYQTLDSDYSNQFYQYDLPNQAQNPNYPKHPSPTFVPYSVPVVATLQQPPQIPSPNGPQYYVSPSQQIYQPLPGQLYNPKRIPRTQPLPPLSSAPSPGNQRPVIQKQKGYYIMH